MDGFYQDLPGWIDDPTLGEHDVNHGRKDGGRGSILFKPTEKLSVRLTAFGQETLNHGTPYVDYNPATLQPIQDLAQHRLINDRLDFQYQNYNGTIHYDAGPVTFISSTSYSIFDTYDFGDVSPLYGPLFTGAFGQTLGASLEDDTHLKKFSQEIRLASPSAQRLEWQVGAFYTRETAALDENLSAFDPATRTTPAGLLGLEVPILNSIYTEWAGFGNLTLHLSRAFDIQAGGRYSSNSQTATETVTGPLVGPGFTFSTPSSGDSFTWSVAPRWHLNPDTMIYARIATGFRPGGPNDLPVAAPPSVPREYGPDRTVNYEIGARTALLDHRLSIDVDAFYIDWKDIQL
ncbi:MAG: TonB-dependent receptor domain-containing protein, partial [Thermoplasmata archaeon]